MVTGELKRKIDALWETFWTGGLTNPLTVIEQITYLMFIHDLDSLDDTKAKEAVMLDVPYTSIFGGNISGPCSGICLRRRCSTPSRRGCSPS